jgi:hypothetical protein
MKQFTYQAPLEIYDTSPSQLKTITANYTGLPTIWIAVNKQDNIVLSFISDGELPQPEDKPEIRYQLLSQENPNQVILMDMLDNCKGPINTNNVEELIHTFSNGFEIKYTRPEDPDTLHTYDRPNVTINQDGLVTYPWRPGPIDQELFYQGLIVQIDEYTAKLQSLGPAGSTRLRTIYTKVLEVLTWVRDNTSNIKPWKINLPTEQTFD